MEQFEAAIAAACPLILVKTFSSHQTAFDLASLPSFAEEHQSQPLNEFEDEPEEPTKFLWFSLTVGVLPIIPDSWLLDDDTVNELGTSWVGEIPPNVQRNLSELMKVLAVKYTNTVLMVSDPALILKLQPQITDTIHNMCGERGAWKAQGNTLVLLSGSFDAIPTSIANAAVSIDVGLPDADSRRATIATAIQNVNAAFDEADQIILNPAEMETLVEASKSLTAYEIEQAVIVHGRRYGRVEVKCIQEALSKKMAHLQALTICDAEKTFTDVVGFDDVKSFLKAACRVYDRSELTPEARQRVAASGVLLLGVPGCGKTTVAKAAGPATGWKTVVLDLTRVLSKYVGESEAKLAASLAAIKAQGRVIVIVDEIEKVLAGAGGDGKEGGSSSVMSNALAQLLIWLDDATTEAILVATCNDMSKLPPEFTRAGRWDLIYMVDVPNEEQTTALLKMYAGKFDVKNDLTPEMIEGWTGAEIEQCFKLAALLEIQPSKAKSRISPVSDRMGERLANLRQYAESAAVDANTGERYRSPGKAESKTPPRTTAPRRRRIRKSSSAEASE
jgi:SpoVK/Ycf46/Vps4 family AAA+-type ATPase